MLKLILDAVRIAVSKDTREGVAKLISAVHESPAWSRDIVTLEASFSADEGDRLHHLRDVVVNKLRELKYSHRVCENFQLVYAELTHNAIEHGRPTRWRRAHLRAEISPTYVSLTVRNPWKVTVDVLTWISRAKSHLLSTGKMARGRGLLLAYRKADSLEQVENNAVKCTFYRDHVQLDTIVIDDVTVIVVVSGRSNPSLGTRISDFMDSLGAAKIVICLDPRELETGDTSRALEASGMTLPEYLAAEKRDLDKPYDSRVIFELADSARRTPESRHLVRLVVSDDDLSDLMPEDMISRSVGEAVTELRKR